MKIMNAKILILGIIFLMALAGLAGCGNGTVTVPQGNTEQTNGTSTTEAEPAATVVETEEGNVLQVKFTGTEIQAVPDLVLIKAPEGAVRKAWTRLYPSEVAAPVVTSAFAVESGNEYTVEVFAREPRETLIAWNKRTNSGDDFESPERVNTKNDKTAHVYIGGSASAIPWFHVLVMSDAYVYRVTWTDPSIPASQSAEAIMQWMKENPNAYVKTIPEHFLSFVKETEFE